MPGKGLGEDTHDTAVLMENNQDQENSVSEPQVATNGELKIDEDKDEGGFHDMLWHIGLDEDLEETQLSVFEGVIGSTKLVS